MSIFDSCVISLYLLVSHVTAILSCLFRYSLYFLFLSLSSTLFALYFFFFFNDTAPTEIYPLSLPDALPISRRALQPERGVAAAEAEGGAQAHARPRGARGAAHVELARGIRLLVARRARHHAVARGEQAHDRLQRRGGAHRVAQRALDGIDGHGARARPERAPQHGCFDSVVQRSPCAVSAHEVHGVAAHAARGQRAAHGVLEPAALGIRRGDVRPVAAAGVTQQATEPDACWVT